MGGRGASSGVSVSGKRYGTEYKTLYKSGNIKFVRYNDSDEAKVPMETMTKGRVYVTVNRQDKLKSISYYDKSNKRYKQIDLDHDHNDIKGVHTHWGYFHKENGTTHPTDKEKNMVDRVTELWYNYINGK